jgi:hypothetical protein
VKIARRFGLQSLLIGMLCACGGGGSNNPKAEPKQAESDEQKQTEPHDDLTVFTARFGPPDSDTSTENEKPPRPFVTRRLIYEAENLRVVYMPDVKIGTPPPFKKWKLFGFLNNKTNEVIEPEDAIKLMAHRDQKNK